MNAEKASTDRLKGDKNGDKKFFSSGEETKNVKLPYKGEFSVNDEKQNAVTEGSLGAKSASTDHLKVDDSKPSITKVT